MKQKLIMTLLLLSLTGCVSLQDKRNAMLAVNEAFKQSYERTLAEIGVRTFAATRPQAFTAMQTTLKSLGFRVIEADADAGYLNTRGPAPSPLSRDEWDLALETDLPFLQGIVSKYVGVILASTVEFNPESFAVVVNALTIETPGGVEVSATMRLKEISPSSADFPRREYPPPVAFKMGLSKIWREFERHLAALRRGAG